jgi:catecholate siderophore receptor
LNGDQFRIRGFQAKNDIYVDGLRDFGVYQRDSFNIESVQVIKGPSSETFGLGTVGGAINTISKRAFLGELINIDGSFGSGPLARGTADVNRQIDATTAVRLNAMVHRQDIAGRDNTKSDRWGAAASLGFGIGTDTQWFLNYFHQDTYRTPDYGVPTILAPGRRHALPATEFGLPRNTSFSRSTDQDKATADLLTSLMKWQVNDWLTITNDTRLSIYTRDFVSTAPTCTGACITGFLAGRNPTVTYSAGGGSAFVQDAWGFQNVTAGVAKFHTGPFRHEAVFGLDYFYQSESRNSPTVAGRRPDQQIRTPVFASSGYWYIPSPTGQREGNATNVGAFVSDRVWIFDQLSILGGVRYDDFSSRVRTSITTGRNAGQLGPSQESDSGFASPKVSVILEPNRDQTFYLTYAQSTSPSGQFVASATGIELPSGILPPERSELFEVGSKINLLDGKLGLTGSVFRVNKSGSFDVDPITGLALAGPLDAGESRRVQGFEVGATGNLTEDWSIQLAYTRLGSRVLDSSTRTNIGNKVQFVPENAFSLFTTYNVAPFFSMPGKLLVGGGVFWDDGYFAATDNITFVPSTFSLDSLISYEIKNIRIALNGYNLTDELNYGSAFSTRATPTSGRTLLLSMGVKF